MRERVDELSEDEFPSLIMRDLAALLRSAMRVSHRVYAYSRRGGLYLAVVTKRLTPLFNSIFKHRTGRLGTHRPGAWFRSDGCGHQPVAQLSAAKSA